MTTPNATPDPLDFLKNMWSSMGFSLPGMATPTLDVGELDQRIKDLKAVEGWLKLNLNTLQMSIQGLEMQRATMAAMQAMSQSVSAASEGKAPKSAPADPAQPFANAALWPWNLMQPPASPAPDTPPAEPTETPDKAPRTTKPKK